MKSKGKLKKSLVILVTISLLLSGFGGLFPQPVSATGAAIPGKIEAESYSSMYGVQFGYCVEGTTCVAEIHAGDWMDFIVDVEQAGTYDVSFRVSSPYGANSAIQLKSGATVLATIDVPATGAWQTWQTTSGTVTLSSGEQTLRVYTDQEGWALNWFELTANAIFTPAPTPTPTPAPVYGELDNFLNQLYSGTRNNFTGQIGYEFTPSENIQVAALGRPVSGSMNDSHTIRIWDTTTSSVVASASVTSSSPTDSLGYKYETISTVTLVSGRAYRITSTETSGGDQWMDIAVISNHDDCATINYGLWDNSSTGYPNQLEIYGRIWFCSSCVLQKQRSATPSPTLTPSRHRHRHRRPADPMQ